MTAVPAGCGLPVDGGGAVHSSDRRQGLPTDVFDSQDFRHASGQFPTGVTVVTTLDADGRPVGLTANSFSSVSLTPPLVLFCLVNTSDTMPAFETGRGFVVHVLAGSQQPLGARFATKGIERFDGVEWEEGHRGLPVIPGALATFECDLENAYDGGDHVIYVGRVVRLSIDPDGRPALGYFRSRWVTIEDPSED